VAPPAAGAVGCRRAGVRGLVVLGEQNDDVGEDAMIAARNVVGRRS
jgi:hypothetical protein